MRFKRLFIFILLSFCLLPSCASFATTSNDESLVNAPVAILMDADSGKVLYEKGAYDKMFPASTTKIMTAILALENRNLTDIAKVSYNAVFTVPYSYTTANLQVDEELSIEQLLNVLLIPSANDAANVIAEDIGGSVESFASMMNTKANEIGCKNTHFVNANGVHNESHYSTAYDLALIGRYAMKNETFRKLVSTVSYTLPATNKYDMDNRTFVNTNKLINNKSGQFYKYATGIKTGYTDAAKNCIVASAKKDNLELICVILGANNDVNTNTNKFNDCISLFDYGFENYSYKVLKQKNSVYKVISPSNASSETKNLNLLFENDITVLMNTADSDTEIVPDVELPEKIYAPISKGDVIGKVSYTVDGINYTTNLIAGQDIEANSIPTIVIKIALIIMALWIFKIFLGNLHSGKRYKKKSRGKKKKSSPYRFSY